MEWRSIRPSAVARFREEGATTIQRMMRRRPGASLGQKGVAALLGLLALGGCGDDPSKPLPVDGPPQPISLRLAGAGPLADTLEWTASQEADFARYRIYRLESRDEQSTPERDRAHLWAEIDSASQISAIDSSASPGYSYAYWLEVIDQAGQIGASAPLLVTTPRLPSFGIGLAPRFAPVLPDELLDLELWIESAPEVFGVALDLSLPSDLELIECLPGDFLGPDGLMICQPQEGGIGLSLTRLRGEDPIGGFGVLAHLRVRATESGSRPIGLQHDPDFRDEEGGSIAAPEFWGSTVVVSEPSATQQRDAHEQIR